MAEQTFQLLVIGDDALARAGLRALAAAEGLRRVAEREPSALDAEPAPQADAVAFDLGPSAEALDALREAARRWPVVAVLWSEDQAREAIAAGARGLLRRDASGARLVAAARAVADGLLVVDPALADAVLRPAVPAATALVEPLTPRETQVLPLLVEGLSNRAIGARLAISEHTAKFHVNAILTKLGAATRAEAVTLAARLGLVVL